MNISDPTTLGIVVVVCVVVILAFAAFVTRLLRTVDAGTIRIVSWFGGNRTNIYKGPGKSLEIPLLTTGTTIPAKAINIDLDIADQTADVDRTGQPRPIKVRVLASAIVSVGDTNEMVRTAANRFFAKPYDEQTSTLTDLLTSTGRRAINLLHHDELFNAKAPNQGAPATEVATITRAPLSSLIQADEDDRLAIIIKSACSRELQDLGLVFNSLNIKSVQSDVAEARRRQSAVEAKANADIVQADQERRAKEAQLGAEQAVSDKQRELDQRKAENAAMVASAEAKKQDSLAELRIAELRATQTAQAEADSTRVKIQAEAAADAEAIRLRKTASAQADAIREVNRAMAEGGNNYLILRQLEMLPQIVPHIASALAQAKLVNISSDSAHGAAPGAADQITQVIQTVIAAQLVNTTFASPNGLNLAPRPELAQPAPPVVPPTKPGPGSPASGTPRPSVPTPPAQP